MPMVIAYLIITASHILIEMELIKEELYDRLTDDFNVPLVYICWWILLGFFGGFSYVPFFN